MRRTAAALVAVAAVGSGASAAAVHAVHQPPSVDGSGAVQISSAVQQVGATSAAPPSTAVCLAFWQLHCYSARQIERAYDLPALYARGVTGRGQTIVVVDPFGSPTIAHDLQVFDAAYHLSAPPSFRILTPVGRVPAYVKSVDREGWAGETTLDVEYAHTIAPGANILLVETPATETEGTTGFPQIVAAENYVISHHLGAVISQSFDATERTFPSPKALLGLRTAYVNAARHHVTVLDASGDGGPANETKNSRDFYLQPTVEWPASDPLVTAVGGTTLTLDASGQRTAPDVAWNDTSDSEVQHWFGKRGHIEPFASGGGVSAVFARPGYQDGVASVVAGQRGIPDISMSASCSGALNVFHSYPGVRAGWSQFCGTSASSPMFAGIVALADQMAGHPLGPINAKLYALAAADAPGIVDVTQGNSTVELDQGGVTSTVAGFAAGVGYDLTTGVGTIDADLFVPELADKT